MQRIKAFTLYELLITVIIIGTILAFGVPNLTNFTKNTRLSKISNDLLSSYHLARSEAARSKNNVTICASSNSMDDSANCGGNLIDGWIVFMDIDGDLNRSGDGENIIRAYPPINEGNNIITNAGSNYFSFNASGVGRGNVNGSPSIQVAMICDDRGINIGPGGRATARQLIATSLGRATIINDHQMILASGGTCP